MSASREAGLYSGKTVWYDALGMLRYAVESDSRTSFRLFCRTRYETSSESNVSVWSDYDKAPMSGDTNAKVKR